MLTRVCCHGIVVTYRRLKMKEFEARDNTAVISFLHRSHLRVLVPQRYKIPESRHFNQLIVELGLDFLYQYLRVRGHVINCASMKQNEVKYFRAFCHVFFPLSLFT